MKMKLLAAAIAAMALTTSIATAGAGQTTGGQATAGQPDVVYTVLFLADGKPLASPTVVGQFGQTVRIEAPGVMRVEVMAQAPDAASRSFTTARMSIFKDGAWQAPKEMSMQAMLTMTPSFEYSVDGTPYRFVVMPRRIVPAANDSGL